MKKFITLIMIVVVSLFQKSFSQITYPCGVYFIGMNGTSTDGGEWSQAFNSNDITLASWFKLTDAASIGKRMDIFNRYDFNVEGENTNFDLSINESGNVVFKCLVVKSDGSQVFDSVLFNLKPQIGVWYHVAITFDGISHLCATYVDGEPANSKAFAGAISYINVGSAYSHYMTFGFRDGGQYAGYSNFFKGYLDEAVYCSKALAADKIKTLAQGVAPGSSFITDNAIVIYHKFDDYPGQPNYGVSGGSLPTSGQYYYCPATLTTAIIDPNPSMILDNGSLNTDQSKMNLNARVTGAATDGVTKLLLVADADVPVTFSLPDPKDGALYSLDEQGTLTTQISITPQNGKAVCVYEVPDGYGVDNPVGGRNITVQAYYTSDNTHQTNINIHLITPPVVLVHGMWSNPAVWSTGYSKSFSYYLSQKAYGIPSTNRTPYFYTFAADYEKDNFRTFDPLDKESIPGRLAVKNAIDEGLSYYRNSLKIAASQVDVIGHSLGGLLTRSLATNQLIPYNYFSKETYIKGYVHKLITLGSPHKGSPFGGFLIKYENAWAKIYSDAGVEFDPLSFFFSAINQRIGSCHSAFDFNSNSTPYSNLGQTPPFKTFAVVGNHLAKESDGIDDSGGSDKLNAGISVISAGQESFSSVFKPPYPCDQSQGPINNDLIVGIKSQIGGGGKYQTFFGTAHSWPGSVTETNNPLVYERVFNLLLSDNSSDFGIGFPSPLTIGEDCSNGVTDKNDDKQEVLPTIPEKIYNSNDSAYIKIISPANDYTLTQGANVSIHLEFATYNGAKPDLSMFMIQGINDWITVPDFPPYAVEYELPTDMPIGKLNLLVLALDSSGIRMADTSHINILPAGNLYKIVAHPSSIMLDSANRTISMYVEGYFENNSDTSVIDITNVSTGTVYSSQKANTVFKISSEGIITATNPGIDSLIITHSNKTIKIPVEVNSNFEEASFYENNINFPPIPNKIVTDEPFGLQATSSSGENVTFTLVSGPVELQNGIVIIKGTGNVIITANSGGNIYFEDARPITRSFNISASLPLSLLNFNAILSNKQVLLNWQTTQEINTSHFIIERSTNGADFSSIGKVIASGNSSATKNYSYIDDKPISGTNYYRLKMVDLDGQFIYSKIIAVKNDASNLLRIYPNPANEILYVQANEDNDLTALQIFDAGGRKLKEEKVVLNGNATHSINIKDLPKGVYNLLLKSKTINEHQKFVKQ
jgi:pimeloyl-ACP methyl ester carboxylesterase